MGVFLTLYIDYRHTRVKQYYKEGRALRHLGEEVFATSTAPKWSELSVSPYQIAA